MLVRDAKDRELLFEVPKVPAYRAIREGMHCEVVVVSREPDFDHLTGVTEAYVPEAGVFVGHHPLLRRSAFLQLLARRRKRRSHAAAPATQASGMLDGNDSSSGGGSGSSGSSGSSGQAVLNSKVPRHTRERTQHA
ncbi:hypothetical protein JKP88DRAFT_67786 [Tribonema minus]|uniref:Uncharacterized protein n=1 Tax=Tribonema minus TaxID=303371 RepID=A0A836CBX6_9STRA|nr:hypothetical protein JKP88DRAFT_67786 [Tribonema minus]